MCICVCVYVYMCICVYVYMFRVKLDKKKAFDQLYLNKVAPPLEAVGVAPGVSLGLMRQMTGVKVMPVVKGRCLERGIRQVRPESIYFFVLVLSFCLRPLIQRWYDQEFCVGANPLAALGFADFFSWEPELEFPASSQGCLPTSPPSLQGLASRDRQLRLGGNRYRRHGARVLCW